MQNKKSLISSKKQKPDNKTAEVAAEVAVIGSGIWGLALCELLAGNGHIVNVLSCFEDEVKKINRKYHHITASTNLKKTIDNCQFIFIVVPSGAVVEVLKSLSKEKISSKVKIILCSKGIEGKKLELFSVFIEKTLPDNNYAILSGPNFAVEVAKSLPTTTTIASKNKNTANQIISLLKNNYFLPIASNDVVSAQIFGAIKNILAIGCGIIDGLKLGSNASAALILRGILESNILIKKLGGDPLQNFVSPCGLGDLFLTCSSKQSRNNSLGFLIGSGKNIQSILDGGKTYEGFNASKLMIKFAKKHQTPLPLCEKINKILQGNFSKKEIKDIISKAVLNN